MCVPSLDPSPRSATRPATTQASKPKGLRLLGSRTGCGSYRSPCLSLRLPPGAMFSIGLLNIQKQRQSRVKGGLAKIAKQRLVISDPLGIIEVPACFRRQLQTVRLHGDRALPGEPHVHARAERVHASLSRCSLTMYTKLHADAAQSGTRLPSSAQPSAPTCGAPSSTGRAVVDFEFHRLTNRERLDLLSDHAIRPACGEGRRWPRRGGSRLSMWRTRFLSL
jgi:hypothetical protein